jgi:hypothetical protein
LTVLDFISCHRLENQFLAAAVSQQQSSALGPASRLYRAAEFFMSANETDQRRAVDKFIEQFYLLNDSQDLQRIRILYGTGHLSGLRLRRAASSNGTIVIHAGFDAYVEEFAAIGRVFTLCGYDVVKFDGPGQGSTLMSENMPMTREWDGGYLAIRAAAFEPRIKRVVAFDVMLDFFRCVTSGAANWWKMHSTPWSVLGSVLLST